MVDRYSAQYSEIYIAIILFRTEAVQTSRQCWTLLFSVQLRCTFICASVSSDLKALYKCVIIIIIIIIIVIIIIFYDY